MGFVLAVRRSCMFFRWRKWLLVLSFLGVGLSWWGLVSYRWYYCPTHDASEPVLVVGDHERGVGDREAFFQIQHAAEAKGWRVVSWRRMWGCPRLPDGSLAVIRQRANGVIPWSYRLWKAWHPEVSVYTVLWQGEGQFLDPRRGLFEWRDATAGMTRLASGALWTSPLADLALCERDGEGHVYALLSWYPTVALRPWSSLPRRGLFYSGANWDKDGRGGKDFIAMLGNLHRRGVGLAIYGPEDAWKPHRGVIGDAYRGYLAADGRSVLAAMERHEAALLWSSPMHYAFGIPSARVFEAVAAGMVVISDDHSWVRQWLGGDGFTIARDLPPERIASEVARIMQWIEEHPEESRAMARRAYDRWRAGWVLEDALERLRNFHRDCQSLR